MTAARPPAPAAALDVGGVEPDEGHWRAVEGPCDCILTIKSCAIQMEGVGPHSWSYSIGKNNGVACD